LIKEENNLNGLDYNCTTLQPKGDFPFIEVDQLSFKEKICLINELHKEEEK